MGSKIYKNKLRKAIIFLILFFSLVILSLGVVSAADYGDIRDQVNGASSGDTINLGSGTYNSDGSHVSIIGKNLTIRGSSDSNRATLNGGDISRAFLIDEDSVVTLRYINFVGASSPRFHAISSYGKLIVENCTFNSCNGDSGAAIYLHEGATGSMIVNSRFINNKADNEGDNDYTAGGAVCIHGADNVEIRSCYFSGNSALDSGGALVIRGDSQNTKIVDCEFVNNQAPNGGAIYNQIASTTITGCTFTNNKASNVGGAIYSIDGLNITNSKFTSNSAKEGGVIYSTSQLRINGSSFSSNTATNNGGAIYSTSAMAISSSSFNKNTAKNNGGGIYTTGSSRSTITGSKFTNNSAKNGGGIYNNAPLSISSSNFVSNKASTNGGGIYSRNGLNISKSTISKNSAAYGSGVYSSSTLRVDSSSLSSNSAKFIKIIISAPNSAKSGSNIAIKSGLVYGDNVVGAFYTTNGNVFVNGNKSTVSNYSPNKKITLNFNGKSLSKSSGKTGIATFSVSAKVSKTKTFKATISSIQGSKKFSTSKNIKFIVNNKIKVITPNKGSSNSSRVVVSTANQNGNSVVLPENIKTIKPSNTIKQVFVVKGKKKIWINVSMSKNHTHFPDKKIRIGTKYTEKTVTYKFVKKSERKQIIKPSKKNKYTKTTTYTTKKGKKIIKVTIKVKISYKYQNVKNPFLSVSTKCEVDNKQIKDLAKKITKGKKTKLDKANAIFVWVRKSIRYNETQNYSAVQTLNNMSGGCIGHSNLIVALCRAVGIPAIYEAKYRYNMIKNEHQGHVWALIYVNKWHVADGSIKNYLNYDLPIGSLSDSWTDSSHSDYKYMQYLGHVITHDNKKEQWTSNCNGKLGKNHKCTNIIYK